ncbi:WG repeat-containing protein [uncultured Fluviicola sp.]|uniref:WG repeat-containing protein n=1 Tax=uncultured Fluviicola sp. TaxID=463303 RepID=UPI0025F6441E|nr:WG repeat-containing protein [uncultured Fluviicola sp.]
MIKNSIYCLFFLFVIVQTFNSFSQEEARFKIIENNKFGYIDQTGKVIIPPVFLNAGEFSDGLAAVRVNGRYGYIDIQGKFIIPAAFDYADAFNFGFASVYINGNVKLIDKKGKEVINNRHYRNIRLISSNKAIVNDKKDFVKLIDIHSQKLLSPYSLERVFDFTDGVAIVSRLKRDKKESYDYEVGLMDTNGRMVVDFGRYIQIKTFANGFALVKSGYEKDDFEGYIDTKGRLIFKRQLEDQSYLYKDLNSGMTIINFKNYWDPVKKEYTAFQKQYTAYINLKGEILLNDTLNWHLEEFSDGRVFIKEKERYHLYDTQLKRIGNESYGFVKGTFHNGIARVMKKGLWGIIDTNGRYLFEPKFDEIVQIDYQAKLLIYESSDSLDQSIYGIANLKGELIGLPIIQDFDSRLFQNDLLRVLINDRLSYLNKEGVVVWEESDLSVTELPSFDTEYMISGYFTAISDGDEADLGGFGKSRNSAKQITDSFPFETNKLSVWVNEIADTSFSEYKGFRVYVANKTADTIRFGAQDSRLYMNVQAKNKHGKWADIEHLPSSWCGNSYHRLKLMPNEYWPFVTPAYEGEYKTKLRIKLEYSDKGKNGKEELQIIYSNEYDGSVNPGQFWNKDHHIPAGIMDPYSY